MALLGSYEGRVDPQGRIVVPSEFRQHLPASIHLTRGWRDYIAAYPVAEWEKRAEQVRSLSPFEPEAEDVQSFFFSWTFPATMDRQGRVVLPPLLRDVAGIQDAVVFSGLDSYFQIWSLERWKEQRDKRVNPGLIARKPETGHAPAAS